MLFRMPLEALVLLIPALFFALSFHEFAHAWMANRLGDSTATRMGRLSLNPFDHLDPMGTIMILFVGFGWAKPVPVNASNLRHPRSDMMKIAFAGPASNLFLSFLAGMTIRFLNGSPFFSDTLFLFLIYFAHINTALAVFNMLPIPPLDGSQIFSGIMVRRNPELVMKMQMYGPQVLFGLILIGFLTKVSILWMVMGPFVNFFMSIFAGIAL
ncbi:MAG: site-2 protease family protein [Candidatus Marinimicrobia bacterium]|nr:site-2 protease family protein [Candidatus Neomarinimicrobiota bacterium]